MSRWNDKEKKGTTEPNTERESVIEKKKKKRDAPRLPVDHLPADLEQDDASAARRVLAPRHRRPDREHRVQRPRAQIPHLHV
jgi:hypothetical protein